jgi:hypothetical protein
MAYSQSASLASCELLERAEAFWTYHKASPAKPRYYLLCHAIKLVLKAYIASRRSLTRSELEATFSHDLTKLLEEAIDLGLVLSPSTESEIERLTQEGVKYFVCYPKESSNRIFFLDHFVNQHIEALFKTVRLQIVGPQGMRSTAIRC